MKKTILDLISKYKPDNVGVISTDDIPFEPGLRKLCEMNTCGGFGKNWGCPPLVGEVEELISNAKQYDKLALFQFIYKLEDSFDFEGMTKGKISFDKNVKAINEELPSGTMLLGAGGCTLCESCAATDGEPCRFPDRRIVSLEAYGIQVSTLADKCGMKYINGQNTVTYFGAVLFNEA